VLSVLKPLMWLCGKPVRPASSSCVSPAFSRSFEMRRLTSFIHFLSASSCPFGSDGAFIRRTRVGRCSRISRFVTTELSSSSGSSQGSAFTSANRSSSVANG
jgi:hypothetical protein